MPNIATVEVRIVLARKELRSETEGLKADHFCSALGPLLLSSVACKTWSEQSGGGASGDRVQIIRKAGRQRRGGRVPLRPLACAPTQKAQALSVADFGPAGRGHRTERLRVRLVKVKGGKNLRYRRALRGIGKREVAKKLLSSRRPADGRPSSRRRRWCGLLRRAGTLSSNAVVGAIEETLRTRLAPP